MKAGNCSLAADSPPTSEDLKPSAGDLHGHLGNFISNTLFWGRGGEDTHWILERVLEQRGGGFLSTGRRRKHPDDVWEAIQPTGGEEGGHPWWQQKDQQSRQFSRLGNFYFLTGFFA